MSKKILVIDDEPDLVLCLRDHLEAEGYQVFSAYNGLEGLSKTKMHMPDLIIVDILMPGMSGYEVTEQLRKKDANTQKIPIIVITAKPEMLHLFEPFSRISVMQKPFQYSNVLERVRYLLEESGKEALLESGAERPATPLPKKIILAGTEDFILDKMTRGMENWGCKIYLLPDENQIIERAEDILPDFVFLQYCDDPFQFDIKKILDYFASRKLLQKIPFFIFYRKSVEGVPFKNLPGAYPLPFVESPDLLRKVENFIKSPGLYAPSFILSSRRGPKRPS